MGTRGFVGFVADGKETIVYNHWDSYPAGLGIEVLDFCRTVNSWDVPEPWEVVKAQAAALIHVSDQTPPTQAEQEELAPKFADLNVSTKSLDEWYVLLRGTQGSPGNILAAGYAEHDGNWPADSLFCEWGYLYDIDNGMLEVYEGFQNHPHNKGRFADRLREGVDNPYASQGYFPVKLVASFSLYKPPSDETMLALESNEEEPLAVEGR